MGRRTALIVLGASLASGVVAVLLSRLVFPFLSVDNDDAINRLFADTIAHGHLFPPTSGLPLTFRPWLAAVVDGHYVLKYTPVVPILIALSRLLTGGAGLYLAALVAATVAMTYLLARELLGDKGEALTAAVLLAASPLVIVQSALLLPYLPTLLLMESFTWALVRGMRAGAQRPGGNRLVALSGVALGLAFFARAFDAAVLALPVLVWACLPGASGAGRRLRLSTVASFLLPFLGVMGAFLAFNATATGSPFRLPFALLEPSDSFGFGLRRLYPTDPPHRFGLAQGFSGVLRHGALLNVWVAGGSILLVLAVATVVRRRVNGAGWAVAATGVLIPLSYVFFWGPWNATVLWGGTRWVGPFYFLPVLVPVALFGARGLTDLYRWNRAGGAVTAAAMAAVTAATLGVVVSGNLGFTRQNRALVDLVEGHAARQLVFARMETPFLMHPTAVISNRWDLGGPVAYAIERGDADIDAVHLMPERTPYRLVYHADFHAPATRVRARLEEMRLLASDNLELRVRAPTPTSPGTVGLAVSASGVTRVYSLGGAAVLDERVVIGTDGARVAGRQPVTEQPDPRSEGLAISLLVWPPSAAAPVTVARELLPVHARGPRVEVLAPTGRVWTAGPVPRPSLEVQAG